MRFFRILQHLLPRANAWTSTIDKQLRQFLIGVSGFNDFIKIYVDNVYRDIFPQTTRELTAWEEQFGLLDNGLDEQTRRNRLEARWKARGGQDPKYIQDTLQAAGFNVFVHEFWVPGTNPPDVRNPLLYIGDSNRELLFYLECGNTSPNAQCGEPTANCGDSASLLGYALVNKVVESERKYITGCNEPIMHAGESKANCGDFASVDKRIKEYAVPSNPIFWPYFLYIGAETFPDIASVTVQRKNEFEDLCLQICPLQQWLGILVVYT